MLLAHRESYSISYAEPHTMTVFQKQTAVYCSQRFRQPVTGKYTEVSSVLLNRREQTEQGKLSCNRVTESVLYECRLLYDSFTRKHQNHKDCIKNKSLFCLTGYIWLGFRVLRDHLKLPHIGCSLNC